MSKILSILAVMFMVAACGTPAEEGPVAATGGAPVPGSAEDFNVNVGDRIFFALNRSELTPEARATLDRQAAWLQQYTSVTLQIEGHADERGTREYNLALGERRATAVRNYLVARGIEPSRVSTISFGKERPAVLGSNEQAWSQNRRGVSVVR